MHTAPYTMHTAHCTMHNAHCTLHNAHCTMHNAQCTLHPAHCTMHTAQCIMHNAHCTLHNAHCTLHNAQCTLHTAQCTLHTQLAQQQRHTFRCFHAKKVVLLPEYKWTIQNRLMFETLRHVPDAHRLQSLFYGQNNCGIWIQIFGRAGAFASITKSASYLRHGSSVCPHVSARAPWVKFDIWNFLQKTSQENLHIVKMRQQYRVLHIQTYVDYILLISVWNT